MNCANARLWLTAYIDNELDAAASINLQEHLASCADCREAERTALGLRSAIQAADLRAQPSVDFVSRMQSVIREEARREAGRGVQRHVKNDKRWWSFWPVPAWAGAVAILLMVAALGLMLMDRTRPSQETLIAAEVLASHVRSLQADHLTDVPSSDRHTVKPWFQGKLDFAPTVPDLSDRGWTLLGGRLDYIEGRPVAALVYQRRNHSINVFVWPSASSASKDIQERAAQGYQVLHWDTSGMTYWVASDLNRAELLEFARAMRGY